MGDGHGEGIDYRKHVRAYLLVFAALAVLTVITVAVSYLHIGGLVAVGVAVLIATIKGTLVACYFMHLISERKLIYVILLFTLLFFLALLLMPAAGKIDQVMV